MKYLLIENEEGQYIKINGTERYDILECEYAVGPRVDDFQELDNLEQAMKAYDLEVYLKPAVEEVEQPKEVKEVEDENKGL